MKNTDSIYKVSQEPFFKEVPQADTLVVFIHGIVEGPSQFRPFINMTLQAGCSCVSLLLPGHGGSAKDFAHSSKEEWIDYVRKKLTIFRNQYPHLILVGHSMGTLLSLITYAENPSGIDGIIVIATPLHVHVSIQAIRNNLKIAFNESIPANDPAYPMAQALSVARCPIIQYLTWLPRLADLFSLIDQTRNLLPQIKIPLLAIHADRDELVGKRSITYLQQGVPKSYLHIIHLPHSTHFTYDQKDWKKLCHPYQAMLKREIHCKRSNTTL